MQDCTGTRVAIGLWEVVIPLYAVLCGPIWSTVSILGNASAGYFLLINRIPTECH